MLAAAKGAARMSSILSTRSARRKYYLGALAFALVGGAATVVAVDRLRSRPIYSFSVQDCLLNPGKCRNAPVVQVEGALAPGTLRSSKGCATEFGLQSPGGMPAGAITVCVDRPMQHAEACSGKPGFAFYVEHGYLMLWAVGRFEGNTFHADNVFVSCGDIRVYFWRFGSPDEIESRAKRPAE
jgi:hypothetical protein